MKEEQKTKAQLLAEVTALRHKVGELESRQVERLSAEGALLESSSAAIVVVDEAGRIVLVNAGAEQMFGYTRDELIGQRLELLLPERLARIHTRYRAEFNASPRIRPMGVGLDLVGRRKDGTEFPIEVGLSYTRTERGMLAMSFIIDVTERQQDERQRRLTERAIEAATNGIVISDARQPDMPIIYVNAAFERITGYARGEVIGRNCRFLQGGDRDQPALEPLRDALRHGRSCQVVLRNYRKDGTLFWNELDLAPVHDENGRLSHYVGVQNDITERKRADEELGRKNRELDAALMAAEEATRAKSEFLANMSHEIRTPLNAIIGMSGLLLDTGLNDEQRDYAETVRNSSDALLSIINDILDFSKIEASKLELEQQPFDLQVSIEESLDLLAPAAAQKNLELGYLIDDPVPLVLIGDVTRLRQVLVNLLSNAVKFTDAGEIVVSVTATALAGQRYEVHFAVRDTGVGIPQDRMDRLFQPFSQVDASTTRRYGGTGLGLAISMRLSEMMGGRIWVESEGVPGKGSTFHFTILADATEPIERSGGQGVPTELTGRRALIVDDNATNRLILMRQIHPWGMSGRETPSGGEALDWLRQGEPFDLAILDVRMPEMDGLVLAAEIRKLRPDLPLVILTSMGRREPELRALGIAAFLTKPIKPAQLYKALTGVLAAPTATLPPTGEAPAIKRENVAATPPALNGQMGQRHPLRILVAEDNIVNQKVAVRMLERLGYRADVVANGLEVLEALKRQVYDVVLMDVQMPEMDGLEAARRICDQWPLGQRPYMIAMTAYALEGDRERCLAAGMDDYISKPVRIEELVEGLKRSKPSNRHQRPALTTPALPPPTNGVHGGRATQAAIDATVLDSLRAALRDDIADVIGIFLENGARLIDDLRQALAQEDARALEHAAHALKSSSATFGAMQLSTLCRDLEVMGRAGQLDGAAEHVRRAENEFERVKTELQPQRTNG